LNHVAAEQMGYVEQVLAVGAYSDPASATVSGASTDERCWTSVTSASIPAGVAALKIQVRRHTVAMVFFECISAADCALQTTALPEVALHGLCGTLQTVPTTAVTASWHGGRSVETEPAMSPESVPGRWSTDPAVRRLALTAPLLPGDYIFSDTWLGTTPTACVPCPPGMLCGASSI
jgi:hypothetical protein